MGQEDSYESIRQNFGESKSYKPTDYQVKVGVQDESDYVVMRWLYRSDISLSNEVIDYVIYNRSIKVIKDLLNRNRFLEREDVKLNSKQANFLFKIKDSGIKYRCLEDSNFVPSEHQTDEIIYDEEANFSLLFQLANRKDIKLSQKQMFDIFDIMMEASEEMALTLESEVNSPNSSCTMVNFCTLTLSELSKRDDFLPTEEQEKYVLGFDACNKSKGRDSGLLKSAAKDFKSMSWNWEIRRERNKLLKKFSKGDIPDVMDHIL